MFATLYAGELRKQFSLKTVIIMSVVALLIIIVLAAVFDSVNEIIFTADLGDFGITGGGIGVTDDVTAPGDSGEAFTGTWNYTEESVKAEIAQTEFLIEALEKEKQEDGFAYYRNSDYLYYARAKLALLEYIEENELYNTDFAVYTDGSVVGMKTTGFTADTVCVMMLGSLVFLVIIYGAIAAGAAYPDEFRYGTVKLLLLRPVSRDALTGAKLLAALTHVTAAYFACFLVSIALSYAVFPVEHADTLFMFNGGAVTVADNAAQIGIAFACNYVTVLVYTAIAFSIGALTRNKIFAIVTPVILLEVLGAILSISGLGRFFISDAADWAQFAGLGSTLSGGANFFISLAMTALYTGGLLAAAFLVVRKKDVA